MTRQVQTKKSTVVASITQVAAKRGSTPFYALRPLSLSLSLSFSLSLLLTWRRRRTHLPIFPSPAIDIYRGCAARRDRKQCDKRYWTRIFLALYDLFQRCKTRFCCNAHMMTVHTSTLQKIAPTSRGKQISSNLINRDKIVINPVGFFRLYEVIKNSDNFVWDGEEEDFLFITTKYN
jgi:hypothetical protein